MKMGHGLTRIHSNQALQLLDGGSHCPIHLSHGASQLGADLMRFDPLGPAGDGTGRGNRNGAGSAAGILVSHPRLLHDRLA